MALERPMFNSIKGTGANPWTRSSSSGTSTTQSVPRDHFLFGLACTSSVPFPRSHIWQRLTYHCLCRFFSRTLPYSALFRKVGGHSHDNPSPQSNGPPTPAYLTVSSPQDQQAGASPQEGMSPTTQLVHKKALMDRAQLLLDGRDLDLMKQMSKDERRCAISTPYVQS